jgi:hypothetical protein
MQMLTLACLALATAMSFFKTERLSLCIGWLVHGLVGWFYWLVGSLAGWFIGWLVHWLVDSLDGC